MLKAVSWDVLCGHPVPVGLLPKIWVTIMGLTALSLTAGTLGNSLSNSTSVSY